MPSTQAYTVDWSVEVAGQTVDNDVVEVTISQTENKPDSATVVLDTSERAHAVEEKDDMRVILDDGNEQVTFRGRADAVKDDKTDPVVTVDGREPSGELDDVSAVGRIREANLWDVLDGIMDRSAGQIRGITFDPASLKSNYGTFGGSVVFGDVGDRQDSLVVGGPERGRPTSGPRRHRQHGDGHVDGFGGRERLDAATEPVEGVAFVDEPTAVDAEPVPCRIEWFERVGGSRHLTGWRTPVHRG